MIWILYLFLGAASIQAEISEAQVLKAEISKAQVLKSLHSFGFQDFVDVRYQVLKDHAAKNVTR